VQPLRGLPPLERARERAGHESQRGVELRGPAPEAPAAFQVEATQQLPGRLQGSSRCESRPWAGRGSTLAAAGGTRPSGRWRTTAERPGRAWSAHQPSSADESRLGHVATPGRRSRAST
jgi:hypothetical protein